MRTIGSGETVLGDRGARNPVARLWLLPPAAGASEVEACLAVMSAEERDRASRFVFDADRLLYLTAHAALRHALSAVVPGTGPREWEFGREDGGRPFAIGSGPWDCNLSHTAGRIACLVAPRPRCGVDVEAVSGRVAELGEAVFAASELERLGSAGAGAAEAATSLWTLKEAYAKARGLGLRLPFARCEFDLRGGSARLVSRPDGDEGRWRFHLLRAGVHVVAVALDGFEGAPALAVRSGRPDWARPAEWFGPRPGSPASSDSRPSPQSWSNP